MTSIKCAIESKGRGLENHIYRESVDAPNDPSDL